MQSIYRGAMAKHGETAFKLMDQSKFPNKCTYGERARERDRVRKRERGGAGKNSCTYRSVVRSVAGRGR